MPKSAAILLETFGSLLYPAHCAGCGCAVRGGADFCDACRGVLHPVKPPLCDVCSLPFEGMIDGKVVCPNCSDAGFAFDCVVPAVGIHGLARDLVHRMKYGRDSTLCRVLAGIAADAFRDPRLAGIEFDALVPVPLHSLRRRDRGFNQAALIASALSTLRGIPVADVIVRHRSTGNQALLDRERRRQNLRDAFSLRKNARVSDQSLLLVDDVVTTGSTLDACAEVLLSAGSGPVRAITVARG